MQKRMGSEKKKKREAQRNGGMLCAITVGYDRLKIADKRDRRENKTELAPRKNWKVIQVRDLLSSILLGDSSQPQADFQSSPIRLQIRCDGMAQRTA